MAINTERLLKTIKKNPGLSSRRLERMMKSHVRVALMDLTEQGFIENRGEGARTSWYVAEDEVEVEVEVEVEEEKPEADEKELAAKYKKLSTVLRQGPATLEELCDHLNASPRRVRQLIEDAKEDGIRLQVKNNFIGLKPKTVDHINEVDIPKVEDEYRIGIISDTHFGSKYILREPLVDFIDECYYEQGIRTILHCGDWVQGCNRKYRWEVTHPGLSDQCRDVIDTLPQRPGLQYIGVSGNHDNDWEKEVGIDFCDYLEGAFLKAGRNDLTMIGQRAAFLRVGGAIIHMWHPGLGQSYALSYHLQNQTQKYTAIKPQILLAGHWHRYCHVYERLVECVSLPTFQGGQGDYGQSRGGTPAIGGVILSWKLSETNSIREFHIRPRRYYEVEKIYDPHNHIDASPVSPAIGRATAEPVPPRF